MKDTLLFILKQIVDHPEELNIEESASENKTLLTIKASPADIGQIIGKHGRIIKAIRDLMKILAVKNNTYLDVVIAET